MKPKLKAAIAMLCKVKDAIRMPHAWPGGYPLSLITSDGACLCPECGRKDWRLICEATIKPAWSGTGWGIVAVEILWEGGNHCDQCGECLDAYPAKD